MTNKIMILIVDFLMFRIDRMLDPVANALAILRKLTKALQNKYQSY